MFPINLQAGHPSDVVIQFAIRGQFEERRKLMEEIRKRVYQFILSLSTKSIKLLVQICWRWQYGMVNILKPALARGGLQPVGATTLMIPYVERCALDILCGLSKDDEPTVRRNHYHPQRVQRNTKTTMSRQVHWATAKSCCNLSIFIQGAAPDRIDLVEMRRF